MKKIFLLLILLLLCLSCRGKTKKIPGRGNPSSDAGEPWPDFICAEGRIYYAGIPSFTAQDQVPDIPDHPVIGGYITRCLNTAEDFIFIDGSCTNRDITDERVVPYTILSSEWIAVYVSGGVGWNRFRFLCKTEDFSWDLVNSAAEGENDE